MTCTYCIGFLLATITITRRKIRKYSSAVYLYGKSSFIAMMVIKKMVRAVTTSILNGSTNSHERQRKIYMYCRMLSFPFRPPNFYVDIIQCLETNTICKMYRNQKKLSCS